MRAIEIASGMHPLSSEIQLRKAQVLANTGRKSEALSILKKLEKVSSENPDVFLLMGIIYIAMDKEKEALENFEKSIHLADETKEDILISTAISLENAEKFTLAIKYLNQALKIQTTNTGVIFELAYCYERLANYTESIKYYQMFLDEDPFSSHVWFNLGVVYNLTDAFEEAIEAFGYAIAIDDEFAAAYFNRGNTYTSLENYQDAIKDYQEFILLEEDNAIAHYYIGECYEKTDDLETALSYYEKTLQIDNDFADAFLGKGFIAFQKEDFEESLRFAREAEKREPDNPDYLLLIANSYMKMDNNDEADKNFEKAVHTAPDDDEIRICYSDFEFGRSNITKAIEILESGYSMYSNVAMINYRLAAYHWNLKDYEKTESYFRLAIVEEYENNEDFFNFAKGAENDNLINNLMQQFNPDKNKTE